MCGEFFVSRSDAAELFELVEMAFDQIASLVAMAIIGPRMFSVGARRNDRFSFLRLNPLDQCIGVATLVGHHRARTGRFVEQGGGLGDVRLLGARERESKGVSERIDDPVDFGSPASPRTTQSLWAVFF